MSGDFGVNQGMVEERFLRWVASPASVSDAWRRYFEGLPANEWPELTSAGSLRAPDALASMSHSTSPASVLARPSGVAELPPTSESLPFLDQGIDSSQLSFPATRDLLAANELQGRVSALVNAYRVRGHLFADLDPLGMRQTPPPELTLERYGLDRVDPETAFATGDMAGPRSLPLREIVERLKATYTGHVGVEFTSLEDQAARAWLRESMEASTNRVKLSVEEQTRVLSKLTEAESFEQFLHTNYIGAKRFSVEGGESVVAMLDELIERGAELGAEEFVIGMAHRGRLNVMVNVMEMDAREIFAGFDDDSPELFIGGGDVKYHLGYSQDRRTLQGRSVHCTLAFNPSHLEFANPVVEGRVRAKLERRGDHEGTSVVPVLIHGDAAMAGQGIVAETLNLSELPAYRTGGTIHVVIDNQIGFTTLPQESRSTPYCTDVTRMLRCPVFHVNGDDPEAVIQVVRLAVAYRQRFHKDVVVDLFCYRRYGHNEGDEPRFTQPKMYAVIDALPSVRTLYAEQLVRQGRVKAGLPDELRTRTHQRFEAALEETRAGDFSLLPSSFAGLWRDYVGGLEPEQAVDTGVPRATLDDLLGRITTAPEGFTPHSRIRRFVLAKQKKVLATGKNVDWGTGENLAIASLLAEGVNCRITGQDVERGTFSHRHATLHDAKTGARWNRLQDCATKDALAALYDSPLSEGGVLGFEWGYSLDAPDALVGWEAQFGDFANSAQVMIDQFISSSEDKWQRLSGLLLLLPHGFEGQGPEHSSARLERYLALCAEDNMQVVYPTTPAQIFHLLRRQVHRQWRKPLVVMTPKSLLRHKRAVSTLDELAEGRFQRLIDDDHVDAAAVRRVLLCTGKVYYDLLDGREKRGIEDVAIIRFEQLYPFSPKELRRVLGRYPANVDYVWVQEEPWNMGAWYYIRARLPQVASEGFTLRCLSRPESASPATGSKAAHVIEQKELVANALSA